MANLIVDSIYNDEGKQSSLVIGIVGTTSALLSNEFAQICEGSISILEPNGTSIVLRCEKDGAAKDFTARAFNFSSIDLLREILDGKYKIAPFDREGFRGVQITKQ